MRPCRNHSVVIAIVMVLLVLAAGLAFGSSDDASAASADDTERTRGYGSAAILARDVEAVGAARITDDAHVYIPFVLRIAVVDSLPPVDPMPPTPTASRTPPDTATPRLSPTPASTQGPTPKPQPPACVDALEDRLVTTFVDVERTVATGVSGQWTRYPMYTAVRADGSSLIGWSTTAGEVRFTPVGRDGARDGDDVVVSGSSVHGLVAHDEGGGAALVARPDDMYLTRFDTTGAVVFDKLLVGDTPKGQDGSKWIDSWGYEGRLVWTGSAYAAYFGHTGYFAANGKHQGDLLWLFDQDGEQLTYDDMPHYPSWNWGCSHSLDVRLAHNRTSDTLGPMCLSDGFPYPGFVFRHASRIGEEVSADGSGRADGHLGGIVPVGNGFAVNYGTESSRRSYDIALTLVSEHGFSLRDYWLTDTPSIDEDGPHLATYGEDLLAAWQSGGSLMLSVVDLEGAFVEGPVAVTGEIDNHDDFVNFPNGDVTWAAAGAGGRSLVRVVVPYCR